MKKLVLFSLIFLITRVYAIPTIAIPNLVYDEVETTPIDYSVVDTEAEESKPAKKTRTSIVTQVSKQVQKDLPAFNAAIRGAIIHSKQFKVINMPKNSELWTGNTQTILDFVEEYNKRLKIKSHKDNSPTPRTAKNDAASTEVDASDTLKNNKKSAKTTKALALPNYILLGSVVAIDFNENINPVKDTDKETKQYSINIAADYTLINISDNSIMASFTAHGHSEDVKILTKSHHTQVQKANIPLLIKTTAKDLAEDVLQQLEEQLNISRQTYDNESKVITDVKIYN